jgi:F5/8 type C domain
MRIIAIKGPKPGHATRRLLLLLAAGACVACPVVIANADAFAATAARTRPTVTVTQTVPGPTVTETVPGPTVTQTVLGPTTTVTVPGATVTETTTVTQTTTATEPTTASETTTATETRTATETTTATVTATPPTVTVTVTPPSPSDCTTESTSGRQWTAVASSEWNSDTRATNAVDGDTTTPWASTTLPAWLCLGSTTGPAVVTSYTITPRAGIDINQAPRTWTFQGSTDGTTWTTLDSQTGIAFQAGVPQTFAFTNSTAFTYYRIYVTATNGSNSAGLAELTLG